MCGSWELSPHPVVLYIIARTHTGGACVVIQLLSDVVEVEGEQLLDELEVGVVEMGLVVVELKVLFLHQLFQGLGNCTRALQRF